MLLAAEIGVVSVSVARGRVGGFGVRRRCRARDVAVVDGRVVAATADDVVVDGEKTDFGTAVAVGGDGRGSALAADDGGGVSRWNGTTWTPLGRITSAGTIAEGYVAASEGLYRVERDGPAREWAGGVRDVAGGDRPVAATDSGVLERDGGWTDAIGVAARTVAVEPGGRGLAVGQGARLRRADGGWTRLPDLPTGTGTPVDCGVTADAAYVVTDAGTLHAFGVSERSWRTHDLGVPGVGALAVEREPKRA